MIPQARPRVRPSALNPRGITPESQDQESGALDAARETLNDLDALLDHPKFQKFWAERIKPRFEEQTRIALDPEKLPGERSRAVWKRAFLKELFEFPMKTHAAAMERLKAAGTRTILRDGQPPQVL